MKEIIDEKTNKSSFILIGDSKFSENAEVIINGKSYFSDNDGVISFLEDKLFLETATILVFDSSNSS